MRRTSTRKAALTKAKLATSIRRVHQKLHTRLFEQLENRTLFATIPPAVSGPTLTTLPGNTTGDDNTPSVAIDLNNPQKVVAVWINNDATLRGAFSTNGGANWAALGGLPGTANSLLPDLNLSQKNGVQRYTKAYSPTVGIDRNDNVFVTFAESNGDSSSGQILLQRYTFKTPAPVVVGTKSVYPWIGDKALQPMMTVDNNVAAPPAETDSNGNPFPQSDDFAANAAHPGNLYIAWATDAVKPGQLNGRFFNPNIVQVVASSDGGNSFTTPILLNDQSYDQDSNDHTVAFGSATPRLVVSQGDPRSGVLGGQLNVVWDEFRNYSGNIPVDQIRTDRLANGAIGAQQGPDQQLPLPIADATKVKSTEVQQVDVKGTAGTFTLTYKTSTTNPLPFNATPAQVQAELNALPDLNTNGGSVTVTANPNPGPGVTSSYIITFDGGPLLQTDATQLTGVGSGGASVTITTVTNGGQDVDQPATTELDFTVNVTDPRFDFLTDLDVRLALTHQDVSELKIELFAPTGASVVLFDQKELQGADLGVAPGGILPVTFDDEAARAIDDQSVSGNRFGHFRLTAGSTLASLFANSPLHAVTGELNGQWKIIITDNKNSSNPNPAPAVRDAALIFTSRAVQFAGPDTTAAITAVRGTDPNSNKFTNFQPAVSPDAGIGSAPTIAADNTLGAYSAYQGRLYLAYVDRTGKANSGTSKIYMVTSDDGGVTWTLAGQSRSGNTQLNVPIVRTSEFIDGVSVNSRSQVMPEVAVDQATGTVVVQYFDARLDAAQARVTNTIASSIDGGVTFSAPNFTNASQTVIDAITNKPVSLGPVPDNESAGNGDRNTNSGFGLHQGLAVYGGTVIPVWAGNNNGGNPPIVTGRGTLDIRTNVTHIAAGPRVLSGTQGVVGEIDDTLNNTRSSVGGPVVKSFIVTFDRPIDPDPSNFGPNDVTVTFRDPTTQGTLPGVNIPVLAVTPLDNVLDPLDPTRSLGSTQFRVDFTPTADVGTYAYSVGPDISDRIRQVLLAGTPKAGNQMDQNANATTNEPADAFQVPADGTQLPLIVPGPHINQYLTQVIGQSANIAAVAIDVLDNTTLDLTFDRTVKPATFTEADITKIVGPNGNVAGPFTVIGVDAAGNQTFSPTKFFHITTPAALTPGNYTVTLGTQIATDDLALNSTVSAIDITFDRDMDDSTITAADVLRITGPNGDVQGPFSIALSPNNASPLHRRTFRISFPAQQLSGGYVIQLSPNIAAADSAHDMMDFNLNAGLDAFRSVPSAGTTDITYNNNTVSAIGSNTGTTVTDSTTTVPDAFKVQKVVVKINIQHPNDADLDAVLIGPDGTQVILFTNIDKSPQVANFNNTVFDDNASTPIQNGTPPFFGTFDPQQPLAQLQGVISNFNGGKWTLRIRDSKPGNNGALLNWSLTLTKPISSTGLGDDPADRTPVPFRVFTMDQTNAQSHGQWTPMGPASVDNTLSGEVTQHAGAGRVSSIVVEPSDPSGNTVYVAGSGGGVWKTTNFLTHDPQGPTYVPLVDFGPSMGLSIGSIAVFGRNNDPNQSIIFAATGDGNVGNTGVGFLRSTDGGKTWVVLDSLTNFDANGKQLPNTALGRDHALVGTSAFKLVVDPQLSPTGDVIVYAAMSDGATANGGGIYRSQDTGKTWQKVLDGNATDILLDYNSKGAQSNNLQILYAGLRGQGVYTSPNRGQTWTQMVGGVGDPHLQDIQGTQNQPIKVNDPSDTPNGAKGRIVLAKPALVPGNVAQNLAYQDWLFAAVAEANGSLNGLYVTKDRGENWTKVRLPYVPQINGFVNFSPTNDYTQPDFDVAGSPEARGGNYALSLAVDPNNPNIVYLGGTDDRRAPGTGLIRVDLTGLADPHALVPFNHSLNDGGQLGTETTGRIAIKVLDNGTPTITTSPPPGNPSVTLTNPYINLRRDPVNPFIDGSTLEIFNVANFTNDGIGATFIPFDTIIDPRTGAYPTGAGDDTEIVGSNMHTIQTIVDPVTGLARLLIGNDQGVYSVVDDHGKFFRRDETFFESQIDKNALIAGATNIHALDPINALDPIQGSRNGNLQLAQFNAGAVQPSVGSNLANEIAGSLIYGASEGFGAPSSAPDILTSGNLTWNGNPLNLLQKTVSVATDQQGLGTVYTYYFGSSAQPESTDFFKVNGVSRTIGLIQASNPGPVPDPQWPYLSGPLGSNRLTPGNFTVNPLNGDQIVISSAVGRIFSTENQGRAWSVIAQPTDLDSSYVGTLTYGAPDPNGPGGAGNLNDYVLAGTDAGHIFVTFTGGGSTNGVSNWKNISAGLDGSKVVSIVANPVRGTHDAYAITQQGVYFIPDTRAANASWINITSNLKSLTHNIFGDPTQTEAQVKTLMSLAADWRYTIADLPSVANSPTHPVLYLGADSGVYRSVDKGATWQYFPNQAQDGTVPGMTADGGLLPDVPITDLDLSLGNINFTTGQPNVSTGADLLVASTAGRGSYGIRVAPLAVSMALATGGTTSNTTTPTIVGYSEQTAFGNKVHVKLYDITDPNNRILLGETDTDGSGKFTIPINNPLSAGVHALAAQATDDTGAIGPDGKLTVTISGAPLPKISIGNVTQAEGNVGTTFFNFTVSLDKSSTSTITVDYSTADNTATVLDNDYAFANGTVTFNPGETSKLITVQVKGDTKIESDESFFVNLSNPNTNATIANAQGTGTITNDDVPGPPGLSISDVQQAEGNSGQTQFVFDVALSAPAAAPVTVHYATANGTATAGSDYTATSADLTFAAGETSKQITVNVTGDTTVEADETFFVNLSGVSANAQILDGQGKATITNDDLPPTPSFSINNLTKNEGNSGLTPYVFTVTLSNPGNTTSTIHYVTANGSALDTSDYNGTSGNLTFMPGQTTQTITVNVNGDTLVESDENFFVNLSGNSAGTTITTSQGKGTILNDDGGVTPTPSVSIGDVTKAEGNSGSTAFVFDVTLSSAASGPVTVQYATADGTATAGSDYTAISSTTLTFAAGETSKQITVNVSGDTTVEPDETFFVNLTNVSANATIGDAQGQGTITNDDAAQGLPSISINDVIASEGTNAVNTKPFIFTVTLSSASATPVTVNYATADGTATVADNDYQAVSNTLTFAPGETSKQITVPVVGDSKVEGDETFFVNLTNPSGATIADAQGMATVKNDDTAAVVPGISINNVTKKEGNSGTTTFTFTVTLSKSSASNVTVKYATANGTASSGSDYTSKSGTLTFTPGQISKTISISVTGDTTQESDELFFVNLTSPTNATIADTQGVGTIQNDDSTSSSKVSVVTDQTDSTKTELRIWGTNSADTISVTQVGTGQGKAKVTINGSSKGTFTFTGAIVVFGQDGNDKITIASGITRPVFAFGGFGNDSIFGGGGPNVLEGEAGDDSLVGGANRDILIGGDGTDKMDGGGGDDILMPGDFVNNYSFSVLNGLKKEWTRTDADYPTRVNHIMNGGGLNGQLLNKQTCFSSVALKDTVTGGTGMDLFLVATAGDVITDKETGETVTDIGV